jgi:hypothetical protein
VTEGLLYVHTEPGPVPEPEFHDWYDNEHAPARLTVPGIRSGYRYHALDGLEPAWLAWYELDIEALAGARYRAISRRSAREERIIAQLDVLDRRVYRLIDDQGHSTGTPPVVLSVAMSTTDEAALESWYRDEHIPLLHAIPGWRRTRRYRLVEGAGPDLLAFHELDGTGVFDTEAYGAARNTPWRTSVMRTITAHERRLFGFHNAVPNSGR